MVPILLPAHEDSMELVCFYNSKKRKWDPCLTSCPKPFSSLACWVKNNPHSYRHRVSACLNWCRTSAHLGKILSYSISQAEPGHNSRESLSVPEILDHWAGWCCHPKWFLSLKKCLHLIPLTERENTFQRWLIIGFGFNLGYHLFINFIPLMQLHLLWILSAVDKWFLIQVSLFFTAQRKCGGTLFSFTQRPEISCLCRHRYLYNRNCSKYLFAYCGFCEPAKACSLFLFLLSADIWWEGSRGWKTKWPKALASLQQAPSCSMQLGVAWLQVTEVRL